MIDLDSPVESVLGVAKGKKAKSRYEGITERLGLRTVGDLLRHFPRRYLETGSLSSLEELKEGQLLTVVGEIVELPEPHLPRPADQPAGLPPGGRAAHRGPLAADVLLRPAGPRRQVQRAAVQPGAARHLHGQGRHLPRRVAADQPADGALRRRRRGERGPGRAVPRDDRPALPDLPARPRTSSRGTSRRRSPSRGPWSTRCPSCFPTRSAAEFKLLDARTALDRVHAPETWARDQARAAALPVRGGPGHPAGARRGAAGSSAPSAPWRAPGETAACSRPSTSGCRSTDRRPARDRRRRSRRTSPSRTR